mmetsp:Transcript_28675/g.47759  ORF Transcript_28675/g.47759 Transcript_28675/m.47759 type:complete len:185 (-) Transcript_28675:937-1491(-)
MARTVGVLVCSKNSAPPSPIVSAASAGALEILDVYSTANLPRTLNQAREDGFRIVGASSSVPSSLTNNNKGNDIDDDDKDVVPRLYDLQDLPVLGTDDRPVLLVLGSEGHGLRNLVAKACTEFVRIPSGVVAATVANTNNDDDDDDDENDEDDEQDGKDSSEAGVDSLNVSVTGGIMLWHLLSR